MLKLNENEKIYDIARTRIKNGKLEIHHGYDWPGDEILSNEKLLSFWDSLSQSDRAAAAQILVSRGYPADQIPEYRYECKITNVETIEHYSCGHSKREIRSDEVLPGDVPTGIDSNFHLIRIEFSRQVHNYNNSICDECADRIETERVAPIVDSLNWDSVTGGTGSTRKQYAAGVIKNLTTDEIAKLRLEECADEKTGQRYGNALKRAGRCRKIGGGGRNRGSKYAYQIWLCWN